MKSQKVDVVERWVRDGVQISEHVVHRTVYHPKGGKPYIRTLGAKKELASTEPPTVVFTASTYANGIASD